MEGRIHEGEVESGIRRGFPRIPPDDFTALTQAEPLDIQSSAFDRPRVRVRKQDSRLGPERRGCDSKYARTAAEVDDSFGRFVPHESREGFEQELAAGVEFLCAEHAGQGFELELEAFSVNGFDRG
jgi:hypothetical protein